MTLQRFATVSLIVLLTASADAEAVDKDKLRQAACLPQLSAFSGFHFYSETGFSLEPKAPLPEQIVTVRKLLKTDPANVEACIRLGALYAKADNQKESENAYKKAAELCRRKLAQHPDDIPSQLMLAEALQGLEKADEAEELLRQSVKDAPENWQCWLELAEFLDGKSFQIIMDNKPFHYDSPETLLQAMRTARPTKESFSASQPYRKEAEACFDRAIALAPREPKVYRRRFARRGLYRVIDCGFRMYKGEKVDPWEIYLVPPDALEDMRRVADLSGNDYVAIGAVTFFEVSYGAVEHHLQHPTSKPPEKLIEVFPEATRKRLLDNLNRLEKGMRDPDKHKAATAALVLGSLQAMMLKEEQAAEKSFRRCLELDPGRDAAWDMLIALVATAQRYSDALELARRRVKHKDSAHNRLLLAKAYEYLGQLEKAEGEIREGLKRDPDDFMLNLSLADIYLMRGQEEELRKAGELLCKVGKHPNPGAPGENRGINYSYACGIYCGLSGHIKEARQRLEAVRKRNLEYPGIEEALHALDESCGPKSMAPPP